MCLRSHSGPTPHSHCRFTTALPLSLTVKCLLLLAAALAKVRVFVVSTKLSNTSLSWPSHFLSFCFSLEVILLLFRFTVALDIILVFLTVVMTLITSNITHEASTLLPLLSLVLHCSCTGDKLHFNANFIIFPFSKRP